MKVNLRRLTLFSFAIISAVSLLRLPCPISHLKGSSMKIKWLSLFSLLLACVSSVGVLSAQEGPAPATSKLKEFASWVLDLLPELREPV
jgi:hypothetical protein